MKILKEIRIFYNHCNQLNLLPLWDKTPHENFLALKPTII